MSDFIWVRMGDCDNYHKFEFVEDVANELAMAEVFAVEWHNEYGVSADGYTGNNYISLYWGDNGAEAVRGLTDDEIVELNECLRFRVTL